MRLTKASIPPGVRRACEMFVAAFPFTQGWRRLDNVTLTQEYTASSKSALFVFAFSEKSAVVDRHGSTGSMAFPFDSSRVGILTGQRGTLSTFNLLLPSHLLFLWPSPALIALLGW